LIDSRVLKINGFSFEGSHLGVFIMIQNQKYFCGILQKNCIYTFFLKVLNSMILWKLQ